MKLGRLVRVAEHAVPRKLGGTDDLLECGHRVLNDGAAPARRRCPECGPLDQGEDQPALWEQPAFE